MITKRIRVRDCNVKTPSWSCGQDLWLSPTKPGFDSRTGKKFWIGAVPVDKLNYDLWLSTSRPGFDSRTENYLGGAASVEEINKDLRTSISGSGFDSVTAKKNVVEQTLLLIWNGSRRITASDQREHQTWELQCAQSQWLGFVALNLKARVQLSDCQKLCNPARSFITLKSFPMEQNKWSLSGSELGIAT